MAKQIFVNLCVSDLKKSMAFFSKMGFTFNKEFTDKNAACLKMGRNLYAMLITRKLFKGFTPKKIADARKTTEVMIALQVSSKKEVDRLMKKAFSAGARKAHPLSDLGWMYSASFQDLDGHIWEIFWMNKKRRKQHVR